MPSERITKGNCIVFICDGQGSVGYSNYMNIDFIGSTTLTAGYNQHLNKYIGLFLVTIEGIVASIWTIDIWIEWKRLHWFSRAHLGRFTSETR